MAKNYELDTVSVNRIAIGLFEDARDPDTGLYHVGRLRVSVSANGEGASVVLTSDVFLGSGQATVRTPQATYTAINGYSALNTTLATTLKNLYIAAINLDISA